MIRDHVYLYVEDDPLSREALDIIMKRVLRVEHFFVFEDSADFMPRLHGLREKPDIVLLDIHMTPHNGFEVLDMIRQDPDFSKVNVVALTASVMNEEVELLKRSGFDGIIAKPFQVTTFPHLLERVVHGESIWHVTDS